LERFEARGEITVRSILIAIVASASLAATVHAASAVEPEPIEYPWCAHYSGDGGGGNNCGFSTLEQCRATVSGIGGSCDPNPFYRPPDRKPGRQKRNTRSN
jgi:hypothetical protein